MRTLIYRLQSSIAATFLLCSVAQNTHAQQPDVTPVKYSVQAAQFCQERQFEMAETAIAKALESDAEKDMFYTWYVKGFIHKEIYKARESNNPHSLHRDRAVEAFLK